MALVEDEESADRGEREDDNADEVEQQSKQRVPDPGRCRRRLRRVDLAAHVAHRPQVELLCEHAHGENDGEAEADPQKSTRTALADQLVGEEPRHVRQLRHCGEHRPPALAQRPCPLVHAADHRLVGQLRLADLAVELRDQELPHLGIAEPRQQITQRLAGQRLW